MMFFKLTTFSFISTVVPGKRPVPAWALYWGEKNIKF